MSTAGALRARISALGEPDAVAGLMAAVMGLLPEQDGVGSDLAGFYVSTTGDGSFTAWLATDRGLTRYETAGGVSMTVTLPMSRITRIVERISASGLEVLLEMDADDVVHRAPAGAELTRSSRAAYTLTEAATSVHIGELHAFSSAIRVGMHK